MTSELLQYYVHDEPDAFRIELSGSLSGDGAGSVYHAWRTALSIIGLRPTVIDITYVANVDDRGRRLLRLWRRHQARIVAASPHSRALAESVLDEPYPEPAAELSYLRRAAAFLSRLAANSRMAEGRL